MRYARTTALVAHSAYDMFGGALGALGVLGTMTMALIVDAYGPVSDCTGGIAEISGLPEEARVKMAGFHFRACLCNVVC